MNDIIARQKFLAHLSFIKFSYHQNMFKSKKLRTNMSKSTFFQRKFVKFFQRWGLCPVP